MRKWSTADAGALEHSYEAHRDAEIGAEWLRDALAEHASVGAFSAFNLSLLALGAPADLARRRGGSPRRGVPREGMLRPGEPP
jgi:hypothetical protein